VFRGFYALKVAVFYLRAICCNRIHVGCGSVNVVRSNGTSVAKRQFCKLFIVKFRPFVVLDENRESHEETF
jgi:hypothetical protein